MAFWNPFSRKKKTAAEDAQEPVQDRPDEVSKAADVPDVADVPVALDPEPPPVLNVKEPVAKSLPPPVAKTPTDQPAKKAGVLGKFRSALQKTVQILNTDIRDLVGKEGRLVDDEFLDELFTHLVKTDMGIKPAGRIRDQIKSDFRGRKVMMEDLQAAARETIYEIMHQEDAGIQFAESGPTVIMVVGVNGSGKTTSIAKLANRFVADGRKVVLGAGDTFRAAAVEQLSIWAERLGAEIVTGKPGADPASVAWRAVETARDTGADICIVDTAGRLQTQTNLMDELGRIRRVVGKVIPGAPHEVLLVLDATAGQNGLSQARGFSEAAGCSGIVLAKLDGTARGGVAIPIREEFGLPVKFVGLGEKAEDLFPFDVENYIRALFEIPG